MVPVIIFIAKILLLLLASLASSCACRCIDSFFVSYLEECVFTMEKAAASPTSPSQQQHPSSAESAGKKDRRRYKKLRKKATTFVGGPLSGITSAADWDEFMAGQQVFEHDDDDNDNNNTTNAAGGDSEGANASDRNECGRSIPTMIGPQVRWRSIRQERDNELLAEGAHQRDVLFYMLRHQQKQQSSSSRQDTMAPTSTTTSHATAGKRSREEVSSSSQGGGGKVTLPAWVTLHNAVAISSVLLLEVHLSSSALLQSVKQKLENTLANTSAAGSVTTTSTLTANTNSTCASCLAVPTRWFTNQTPKSIAESLLYAAPPKPPKRSKKEAAAAAAKIVDCASLYQALLELTLTAEQMIKEGYPLLLEPCAREATRTSSTLLSDSKRATEISFEDAQSLIQPFLVQFPQPNDDQEGAGVVDGEEEMYVAGPSTGSATAGAGRIFALDCEMVDTVDGKALARFTLIQVQEYHVQLQQASCRVVWDTLVQPTAKITNYLTQYSGVSAALLEQGPTVCLAQVQAFLLRQLRPHDILIGHSLENDLHACRYMHRTCVDTAIVFRAPNRQFKYSLRNLTFQLLKRTIQTSNQSHCSEEDAQAALDLAVRRAAQGPSFTVADTRSTNQWASLAKDRTTVAAGPTAWLQKHITSQPSAVHALSCQGIADETRKAVLAWLGSKRKRADLVWGCFELETEADCDLLVDYVVDDILPKANLQDTVVGVALQCRHTNAAQIFQHRRARQSGKATLPWTDQEENRFVELAAECQHGSMLWISSKI